MRAHAELLRMPAWTYREIMEYLDVRSKTTAIRIKQRAIDEKDGAVPFGTKYVKSDSVLALFGTNRERELSMLERKQANEETQP